MLSKRIQKSSILIVIILLIGMSFSSTGINVHKSTALHGGNTLYVGGDGPGNYTKIQDAIDNASDGDTVFVYNGTYVENLIINNSFKLIGEDKNNTIIDGNQSGDVLNITSDYVSIYGFTIQNGESGYWGGGILVYNADFTTIKNNIITKNFDWGILLYYSSSNQIHNNFVLSNGYGIRGYFSNNNNISFNNFVDNYDGIDCIGAGNVISDNNFSMCEGTPIIVGIILVNSNGNIVKNNYIKSLDDTSGLHDGEISIYGNRNNISNNILVGCDNTGSRRVAIGLTNGQDNIIFGNDISNYTLKGIGVYRGSNNRIINNNIRNTEICIIIGLSKHNRIEKNILKSSQKGISIGFATNNIIFNNAILNNSYGFFNEFSWFNSISHNNLLNNEISAYFRYFSFGNNWNKNYWDKPRKLPYPIFGTLGLFIPLVNFDWHPAKEPYDI